MAKRMETRSARILALVLALIMIGSVVVYVFKGSTKASEREIKFEMGKFPKLLNYTPYGAQFIICLNFKNLDRESELYGMLDNVFKNQIDPYSFSHLALADKTGIRSVLIAKYPYPLYFVDVNRSKVYFASESKEEYKGYKVKLRRGVALIDEISPFVLGYPTFVFEVVDLIENNNDSIGNHIYNYTDRICKFVNYSDFSYALILYDEYAKNMLMSKNESVGDFYFVGYRMNNSIYEKVVAIHFTKNGFFASSNKTKNATAYYYFKNFDDGLSIAKIGGHNLTKLESIYPEMRLVEIKMAE